jgi:hypothetical protein
VQQNFSTSQTYFGLISLGMTLGSCLLVALTSTYAGTGGRLTDMRCFFGNLGESDDTPDPLQQAAAVVGLEQQ